MFVWGREYNYDQWWWSLENVNDYGKGEHVETDSDPTKML